MVSGGVAVEYHIHVHNRQQVMARLPLVCAPINRFELSTKTCRRCSGCKLTLLNFCLILFNSTASVWLWFFWLAFLCEVSWCWWGSVVLCIQIAEARSINACSAMSSASSVSASITKQSPSTPGTWLLRDWERNLQIEARQTEEANRDGEWDDTVKHACVINVST